MRARNFARVVAVAVMISAAVGLAAAAAAAGARQAYVMLSGWALYPQLSRQSPIAHALADIAQARVAGIVYGTLGIPPWIRKNRNIPDTFDPNEYNSRLFAMARDAGATLWLQLRVVNFEAAEIAEKAGLMVVMDRCVKIEHGRYTGQLHWVGMNTEIISARRAQRYI